MYYSIKIALIIICSSLNLSVLGQRENLYTVFHLNPEQFEILSSEIPKNSFYIEYGYFIINTSDTSSLYIEKRNVVGRFRVDTIVDYQKYQVPSNLVPDNMIPLWNVNNVNNYHLTSNTHKMPFIKYSGILLLFLNDIEIPRKNYSFNSGVQFFNDYLKVFIDLVNLEVRH